eukprot:3909183-Pyramimonas_sp.AAC.1
MVVPMIVSMVILMVVPMVVRSCEPCCSELVPSLCALEALVTRVADVTAPPPFPRDEKLALVKGSAPKTAPSPSQAR